MGSLSCGIVFGILRSREVESATDGFKALFTDSSQRNDSKSQDLRTLPHAFTSKASHILEGREMS